MRLVSLGYDELVSHDVSKNFAHILSDPGAYHPDLPILVGRTNWDYYIPEGVTNIVPLWDSNADSYVRWERDGVIEYVWLFHDDPNWILIAKSEQGVMAALWSSWSEFQESDDECRRFADAIGFKYAEEALEIWDRDYDELQDWKMNLSG